MCRSGLRRCILSLFGTRTLQGDRVDRIVGIAYVDMTLSRLATAKPRFKLVLLDSSSRVMSRNTAWHFSVSISVEYGGCFFDTE
jgi:hypothetical protein